MGIVEWGAIVATLMLLVTLAGALVATTRRITQAEAKADAASTRADAAGINVAANTMRCETVARLLSEHKEQMAQNYVSNRSLEALENRLVEAISRLGDRLDKLFSRP